MDKTWFNLATFGMEAQEVMWLRCMKLAAGGAAGERETNLMVSEKIDAATTAWLQMMTGASTGQILRGYRTKVRANRRRLSK
jgi:hypothetical protein